MLDTLKKLSGDKLVIVVSHDREFAEQYADRIVELKDGKVISDVTRTGEATALNVRFCEDTVSVRDLRAADGGRLCRHTPFSLLLQGRRCHLLQPAGSGRPAGHAPDAGGQFTQTVQPPPRRYAATSKS